MRKRKVSEATRAKMSAAQKKRFAKKTNRRKVGRKKTKRQTTTAAVANESRLLDALGYGRDEIKKQIEAALSQVSLNARWTTGSGESLLISEMREEHLRNAISYCARRLSSKLGTAVWLAEVAQMVENFANLLREAKRRNIRV